MKAIPDVPGQFEAYDRRPQTPFKKGKDTMKYDEIVARVAERTGLFEGEAAALTRATLATLAERIGGAEARDLADTTPLDHWRTPCSRRKNRPKHSASMSSSTGWLHAPDVTLSASRKVPWMRLLATLREAGTPGEFDDVLSQLPRDFHRSDAR